MRTTVVTRGYYLWEGLANCGVTDRCNEYSPSRHLAPGKQNITLHENRGRIKGLIRESIILRRRRAPTPVRSRESHPLKLTEWPCHWSAVEIYFKCRRKVSPCAPSVPREPKRPLNPRKQRRDLLFHMFTSLETGSEIYIPSSDRASCAFFRSSEKIYRLIRSVRKKKNTERINVADEIKFKMQTPNNLRKF